MEFIKEICKQHHIEVLSSKPLSGGDINQVFKVDSSNGAYAIKLNAAHKFPKMFEVEAKSLDMLSNTESFVIPKVIGYGNYKDKTYLLLEYITSDNIYNFSETFATALAKLHRNRTDYFGLEFNNYIGRLPQHNLPRENNSLDFYINLRLEPQFKRAQEKGFDFKKTDQFYKRLEELIPEENASLIHGDLWSGNYLITESKEACIFDPAIAYAPREMDLAMMKLFGGYPEETFEIYNDMFPLEQNWESRIPLWQLYYILVHVNLFGSSYFNQARQIIDRFV